MIGFAPDAQAQRVWSFALFAIWLIYFVVINLNGLWAYVGVPHISPIFADLGAILQSSDCDLRGFDAYAINSCTSASAVHVYGRDWLLLNRFGLMAQHQYILGAALDFLFMVTSVWVIKPASFREFALCCIIVFSPAMSLGLERANNDLVIFIMTAISATLLTSPRTLKIGVGLALIYFSAALKVYPVILFMAVLFVLKGNSRERRVIVFSVLILTAIWFIRNLDDVWLIKSVMPTPVKYYTTGAMQLFTFLGFQHSRGFSILFIAIIGSISFYLSQKIDIGELPSSEIRFNWVAFVFGLFVLFFTYVANTNYDYRWVFVLLLVPYLFDICRSAARRSMAMRLAGLGFACMIYIMWAEAFIGNHPFALKNLFVSLHLGRFLGPLDWVQRSLKDLSAWMLFMVVFTFFIRELQRSGIRRRQVNHGNAL